MSKSETLFADGLEAAFIGLASDPAHRLLAVYDLHLIREHFVSQGGDPSQVDEHIEFNIRGSWVGDHTPIFVDRMSMEDAFLIVEGR